MVSFDPVLGLLFHLLNLVYSRHLLLESLLKVEFNQNSILLETKEMTNALVHGFVFILELHHTSETFHEELYRVSESLLKLLVVANELKNSLAELCSRASRKMDSFLDLLCEVNVLFIDYLNKGDHERV